MLLLGIVTVSKGTISIPISLSFKMFTAYYDTGEDYEIANLKRLLLSLNCRDVHNIIQLSTPMREIILEVKV